VAWGSKAPPLKLVWFESVTDWLAGYAYDAEAKKWGWVPRPVLPEGVSRPGMTAILAMVMRATESSTNEALVSARWIEHMTGVNQGVAARALDFLESAGWLVWSQRRRNRVKVYRLTIPSADDHSAPAAPGLDSSADSGADSGADDDSDTPGTPGTPQEDLQREAGAARCPNCGVVDGHDLDCAYRPWDDDEAAMRNLAAAGIGFEVVEHRCCEVCDGCEGELIEARGRRVHPRCAPRRWRVA
jgi:hypothetical protein